MTDSQHNGRVPERTYHYLHATDAPAGPVTGEETTGGGTGAGSRRARRTAKQAKTVARRDQAEAGPRPVIEDYDDDPFADEADYQRRRGFIARGRRWWRRKWRTYLHEAVPEDDESVDGLPRILQGWWGRLIMTVIVMGLMVFWTLALGSVVFASTGA